MDIFKQNKILIFLVVILVLLNILSLIGIWVLKTGKLLTHNNIFYLPQTEYLLQSKSEILDKLDSELEFNIEQTEKFHKIRNKYHQEIKERMKKIHNIKKKILTEILSKEPEITNVQQNINDIGNFQAEMELNIFLQYKEIKSLCNNEQLIKFEKIIEKILNIPEPDPPPPH